MERVIPWPGPSGPGWVNAHYRFTAPDGKPRWYGEPFKEPADFIHRAQMLAMDPRKCDIYYCTTVQREAEDRLAKKTGRVFKVAKRDASNATLVKAIWLDVDVKDPPKGYSTLKEAKKAVFNFCDQAGIPLPTAFVHSGGGLHVYWISDRPLTVQEWAPFAEGLKAEAMRLNLHCDYGVTADRARILRVPGTFNLKDEKNPRPVSVSVMAGFDYDFDKDLAGLKAIGAPKVTATVTKAPLAALDLTDFWKNTPTRAMHPIIATGLASASDKLSDGIGGSNLPLDPMPVLRECPLFRETIMTGGKGQGQGLWNLVVLASTWLEDPRTMAHGMSNGYPTYTPDETDAMFDRKMDERAKGNLGWPKCKAFQNEGSKHCAGCKYLPLDQSPLHLTKRVKPPDPDQTEQVVTNPITNVVLTSADLTLPPGYMLNDGLICLQVNKNADDPKAPPDWEYQPVFDAEIIAKPRMTNSRPPTLYLKYKHGDNYGSLNLSQSAAQSDQTLMASLGEAGLCVNVNADKIVRRFMRAWISLLTLATKRLETKPLGWNYEAGTISGFSYGGTLFKCDGGEEDTAYADSDFIANLTPCGSVQYVHAAMAALSAQHHAALEIMALQPWASPLLAVTGHKSASILWGFSDSGGRKSSALKTGMAVWCAPDKVRERGGVTETALENKMDLLRNLPAVLDEVTSEQEIEKVYSLFNRIHEGGQGSRANNKGGLRAGKSWQLSLTVGSNKSIYEFYDRKRVDTDARALRMFELFVEYREPIQDKTEMTVLHGRLEHNYGHLGLEYAKFLALNHVKIAQEYDALSKIVDRELAKPGDVAVPQRERFWLVTVVLTLLAARYANQICRVNYFHLDEIKALLYSQYRRNREWVDKYVTNIKTTGESTEDVWNKVVSEWIDNQIATDKVHVGAGRPAGINILSAPPKDRGRPALIHWLREPALVRVNRDALMDTLGALGHGKQMADQLLRVYGGKVVRKTFLAGIPTTEAKTRVNVWEIPITQGHPIYETWAGKTGVDVKVDPISEAFTEQDRTTGVTAAVTAVEGTPLTVGALAANKSDLAKVGL